MKVNIIGNGEWGNALYEVVKQNCTSVTVLKRGENISECDVLVLSVPTQSLRGALNRTLPLNEKTIIVNTAKGIEQSTHLLPNQIVRSILGRRVNYYTLIGPSFAQEVRGHMPTLVNLGHLGEDTYNQSIKDIFQTDYFRVRLSESVDALEISAAFKNIYAIACGLVQALGYGTNTRIKLIVLAIEEIRNITKNLHYSVDPDSTTGTIGDLILTCNSIESRNFRLGALLASHTTNDALKEIDSTVEGVYSLSSIESVMKRARVKLPLASFVSHIIKQNNPQKVRDEFQNFVREV